MEEKTGKKPYAPPKITRVVLRREQAVLSQCMMGAPTGAASPIGCATGCKNGPTTESSDSGGTS